MEFSITANNTTTEHEFAQTAMQAVVDLMKEYNINFVRVRLYEDSNTINQHSDFLLAYASFDKSKDKWEVMAKERRMTIEERTITTNWQLYREKFIEDGFLNEEKLKEFLLKGFQNASSLKDNPVSDYTNIKQIHLPWVGQNNNYKITND